MVLTVDETYDKPTLSNAITDLCIALSESIILFTRLMDIGSSLQKNAFSSEKCLLVSSKQSQIGS